MALDSAKDLQPRAQDALAASPIYALRDLRVDHASDSLVISGSVASFYHKQLAQEVVRTVSEGVAVVNEIAVR